MQDQCMILAVHARAFFRMSQNLIRKHYVICQHGVLGSTADFKSVKEYLDQRAANIEVILLKASAFPTKTLDGVEAGGIRCHDEFMHLVRCGTIRPNSDVSFLGHSLGGLFIRWALRLIQQSSPSFWAEYSLTRKLAVFVASPHCGIHSSSWLVRQSSQYLFRYVFRTVQDLLLETTVLKDLCDEAGIHALNAFKGVVLYGNITRDHSVTSTSALILPAAIPVHEHQDTELMTITKYVMQHEIADNAADPNVMQLVEKFNAGVTKLTRYLVNSPPSALIPSMFSSFDNSAHGRIICHGILDRSKVGQPMLEHLASILLA